ncbi:MAG: metallophosphoesterase family protein [Rhodomicrobiaceae bacterium]
MAVFFTSDTHFGHDAIIRLTGRPFASVEEMDAAMIESWNATVAPEDTVYHLGDVCFRNSRSIAEYRRALNGTVHLIRGNHDDGLTEDEADLFASVSLILEVAVDRQMIVLCHYPMREWNQCKRGSWHLFGHVHGRLDHAPLGYSLDVGVDTHDFRPWTFDEIEAVFATRHNPFAAQR